jgi:hypothetical protein
MASQVLAVSPENHSHKSWRAASNYQFAAAIPMVSVVLSELGKVASIFPMALVERGGGYELAALFGLQNGQNLFVDPQGRWMARYIPARLRAYPFSLAFREGQADPLLCVDEASGLVGEAGDGEPFFEASGKLAPQLQSFVNFLGALEKERRATAAAIDAVVKLQLLKPLKIKGGATDPSGQPLQDFTGLHAIDEAASRRSMRPNWPCCATREACRWPMRSCCRCTSLNRWTFCCAFGGKKRLPPRRRPRDQDLTPTSDVFRFS